MQQKANKNQQVHSLKRKTKFDLFEICKHDYKFYFNLNQLKSIFLTKQANKN
ncbi:hypothetical protein TTHERM_00188430 (macronuclear) [Tetrahymena thermophila SB210]|uniref:Uncharacterized protein n=1 Tax=Tetrahymena thermophila (strain SB210) TaxID=312017 RepID=I7M1F9_TETTS|nr:hypothetical protein TTHERM_00188430 [Tetrahymena thermophila SB210]EAR96274.1 hypothetical protein TTHERM_00188430 [Tetrahymena thermophila SB210]|eukprot:XP_001016519.1 hypothetical protein TTHERM_00188430 [Tetrahymena thermophila SB210]